MKEHQSTNQKSKKKGIPTPSSFWSRQSEFGNYRGPKYLFRFIHGALTSIALLGTLSAKADTPIPVEIGVGPSLQSINGSFGQYGYSYFGLKLSLEAVVDRKMIADNIEKVPEKYGHLAQSVDAWRVHPFIWIPDTLIIAPGDRTHAFGATWKPIPLGFSIQVWLARLTFNVDVILTYLNMYSTEMGVTNFLRPGVVPGLTLDFPLFANLSLSAGVNYQFYIPQAEGGGILDLGSSDSRISRMGQVFLQLKLQFLKNL